MIPLTDIEARLHALKADPAPPAAAACELLALAEQVLEHWLAAQGELPTAGRREGFRLLALHAQGARLDPRFNACRESCRELVYHRNLIAARPGDPQAGHWARMAAMVALHLFLFVTGKMEVAGLGEFCCSARPLRARSP